MKRKKILFVATKLEFGGIQTALVNAANDYIVWANLWG